MTGESIEMVIHPVRLRILQSLVAGPQTTKQIAERLADVPKSSLYRHLRLLLDSGFVAVAKVRLVHGIQEKAYRLSRPTRLGPDEIAGVSAEDHFRYFTTYMMVLLRGFSRYLSTSSEPNFVKDRVGYSDASFWATDEEFDGFSSKINEALLPLLGNEAAEGRHRHKFAVITYLEHKEAVK